MCSNNRIFEKHGQQRLLCRVTLKSFFSQLDAKVRQKEKYDFVVTVRCRKPWTYVSTQTSNNCIFLKFSGIQSFDVSAPSMEALSSACLYVKYPCAEFRARA